MSDALQHGFHAASCIVVAAALAACGGDSDNGTDPVVTLTSPVMVSASTTGALIDPDGYTAALGGAILPLAVDGNVTFDAVPLGSASVTLGDVASNCAVAGTNPRSLTVVGDLTANVHFAVSCTRPTEAVTLLATDREGTVYTVDEGTGEVTRLFVPVTDDGGAQVAIGVISSMAHLWDTDVWWLGLGGESVCFGCLHTLDAATGVSGFLSDPSGTIRAVAGLAVNPSTGRVYTSEADGNGNLYELDASTGALSIAIANTNDPTSGKGMTFVNDSVLLIGGSNEMVSVNLATGNVSDLGAPALTGFPGGTNTRIRSMATRESDGVIFAMSRASRNAPSYLATVSPATGALTYVGVSDELLDGLAFIPTRLVDMVAPVDPSRVVFVSDRTGNLDVFTMDRHGGQLVQVTSDLADDDDPTLSPDRSQVAFTSNRDGDWEVYVKNADGTGSATPRTSTSDNEWDPVYSPDGSRIVFTRQYASTPSNWDLFSMAADGSDVVQLTDNGELDANPGWSPNGQQLAFMSRVETGDWEIYTTSASALTTPVRLTGVAGPEGVNIDPDWSPDGSKIAFASDRTGQFEIWTMNADGSNPVRLTTDGGDEPNWSADGNTIVFSRGRDGARSGDFEIYIMNADGSGIRPLSNHPADDEEIDWR